MSHNAWLAIAAAVGLGLLVAGADRMTGSVPRGIRNNNPGNLRISDNQWDGKVWPSNDPEFETFSHPVYGLRAMARLLKNYQALYGLRTVEQIIGKYAPDSENNTRAYAEHVAAALGVKPDQPISVAERLPELLAVMVKHENGVQPYSDTLIRQAVALS